MTQEITGLASLKMNALLTVRQPKYFEIGKVTTSDLSTINPKNSGHDCIESNCPNPVSLTLGVTAAATRR